MNTFERLPNEIFHELFEYFDLYELYKIFSQLNTRFENLVNNFKYLQLILYSLEDLNHPICKYFLTKINTLIINHSKKFYNPLTNPIIFSSIRCLILCQPTREQWNSIRPEIFPSLQRLYLINSTFIYRTEELCRLIFSNQFSSLHTCSLPRVSYEEKNQWTYSPILQTLSIRIWDIRVYNQILETCPNLRRFQIEINNHENVCLENSVKKHFNLRSLAIRLTSSITYQFIDQILSFVPNIEYLLLHANRQKTSSIHLDELAEIFQNRIPKLNRIDVDISLPENLCLQQQITDTKHLLFKSFRIERDLFRPPRLIVINSL